MTLGKLLKLSVIPSFGERDKNIYLTGLLQRLSCRNQKTKTLKQISYILSFFPIIPLRHDSENSQIRSVAQSCLTLCEPMNHSMPGLPVHHQLSEFTQTHVHGVSDAIQPSHPLSSPSPPAPNPSQHQNLFQ